MFLQRSQVSGKAGYTQFASDSVRSPPQLAPVPEGTKILLSVYRNIGSSATADTELNRVPSGQSALKNLSFGIDPANVYIANGGYEAIQAWKMLRSRWPHWCCPG